MVLNIVNPESRYRASIRQLLRQEASPNIPFMQRTIINWPQILHNADTIPSIIRFRGKTIRGIIVTKKEDPTLRSCSFKDILFENVTITLKISLSRLECLRLFALPIGRSSIEFKEISICRVEKAWFLSLWDDVIKLIFPGIAEGELHDCLYVLIVGIAY